MKKITLVLILLFMSFCLCSCEAEKPPVYADSINDGTYSIEVKSSSSMFRIVDCQLTVSEGKMTVAMTLSGKGYEKIFLGTREEASRAQDSDFSYFAETSEGKYCYEIPVEALDKEIDCAGFSIRKQKWYDRKLVFQSETLPNGVLKFNLIPVIIAVTAALLVISAAVAIIIKCVKKRGK